MAIYTDLWHITGFLAIIGTITGVLPGIVLLTWALQLGHTTLLRCSEIVGANTRPATGSTGAGLLVPGVRGHIVRSYRCNPDFERWGEITGSWSTANLYQAPKSNGCNPDFQRWGEITGSWSTANLYQAPKSNGYLQIRHIRGASKIKLKKVNKKRTLTVRRVIIFLNISRHPLLI
jgi:hypothetical protein